MVSPKFCWSCGSPIQPDQRFCEQCGADLQTPSEKVNDINQDGSLPQQANPAPAPSQQASSQALAPAGGSQSQEMFAGSLFDPQREFYVLQEKFWHYGSGDILDESGMAIGHMHRIFLSLRAKIELKETTGIIGAEIHRKIMAVRPTYDLKDPNGNLIGRLRKAILNVIHPKIWLEGPDGTKILEARGSFMRYDFVVFNIAGTTVAEINLLTRWKEFFLGGTIFDFSDKYGIRVLDKTLDRRLIIGFCIAIDNLFHETGGAGGIAFGPFGIGRGSFGSGRMGGGGPRPSPHGPALHPPFRH